MGQRKNLTINDLPLFATDEQIGEAVLGFARRKEFSALATVLEREGMPKVSPFWGGRYVPAVKRFFDHDHGLTDKAPTAPNGVEGTWLAGRRRFPAK